MPFALQVASPVKVVAHEMPGLARTRRRLNHPCSSGSSSSRGRDRGSWMSWSGRKRSCMDASSAACSCVGHRESGWRGARRPLRCRGPGCRSSALGNVATACHHRVGHECSAGGVVSQLVRRRCRIRLARTEASRRSAGIGVPDAPRGSVCVFWELPSESHTV